VLEEFDDLLARPVDAVWLPLPIDLHLPFTTAALAAGKAVICEKPAAGCVDDVDAMIAARDRAKLPVAIGFQDLYQPAVALLKRRLAAGEFGRLSGATVIGCWPRSAHYFARNDWAGRCRRDGRWVMDSPASNALAHFLHLALFLLGDDEGSAHPTSVEAELYRANRIETYDTCNLRYSVGARALPLRVVFTHACKTADEPLVTIRTERARITYLSGRRVEIHAVDSDRVIEQIPLSSTPHRHMLASFRDWVRVGDATAALNSTLEMARAHVVAVNAASEAAPVVDIAPQYVTTQPAPDGTTIRAVRDINRALAASLADDCELHATGLAPWAQPKSVRRAINGYRHFAGPAATSPPGAAKSAANRSPAAPAAPAATPHSRSAAPAVV
jgi:predicted dehydrogenase